MLGADPAGPSSVEIIHPDHPRGPFCGAVFDFDGTLSLLRGNWQGLMVPMMVEILAAAGTGEPREELTSLVEDFVTRLTGQPTMHQMQALVQELAKRGQKPADAGVYLAQYLDRLHFRTADRIEAVQTGRAATDEMLVPGARPLLERFRAAGWVLAVFSGTELADVRREAQVLRIDHYFGGRIFGPVNNQPQFCKRRVLRELMAAHDLTSGQIVVIGDGPAEMEAARAVGALALGVASDEVHRDGRINALKRRHLLQAGADVIVADFRHLDAILRLVNLMHDSPPSP